MDSKKSLEKKLPKLPYGEGSFTRAKGKIYFRKTIVLDDGSKKEIGVFGDTVNACIKKMKEKETKTKKAVVAPNKETLINAMTWWLDTYKKNKVSPTSFKRLKDTVRCRIGESKYANDRYQSLTSDDLQKLINSANNGEFSRSSIDKIYLALNEFYRFASLRYKFDNPMLLVSAPIESNVLKETKSIMWFNQDDLDKFIEQSTARWKTGRLRYNGGHIFGANTQMGARIGELLVLQWKDVDFEKKRIYICKTLVEVPNPNYNPDNPKSTKNILVVQNSSKTKKNRYVYMNDIAFNLYKKQWEETKFNEPDDYVICTRDGNHLDEANANDTIKAIQKAAGTSVQNASSHILRHTCASLLYRKGVPTEIIAKVLGDSVDVVRTTYIHFEEERIAEEMIKEKKIMD